MKSIAGMLVLKKSKKSETGIDIAIYLDYNIIIGSLR